MADASFDGVNLVITLPAGQTAVNAKTELYSAWKEWFKTGTNSRFARAFDTTGGDPTTDTGSVSAFYFLRNDLGWRIRPPEENIEVVINGNLYPRVSALPFRIPTIGNFNTSVDVERDSSAQTDVVTVGSGVLPQDVIDIALEVLAQAALDPIHADVKRQNAATVYGNGSAGNLWRGTP